MATNNNFYGSYLKQNNATDAYSTAPSIMQRTVADPYAPISVSPSHPYAYEPNATNMSGYSTSPNSNVRSASYAATRYYPYNKASVQGGGGINDLPRIHPGDQLSLGDAVNYMGNLANNFWEQFGPLQGMTADIYKGVLSGNIPAAVAPLIAQRLAQVQTAIPQAQEQARNTMQGGMLQQALGNIAQMGVTERAKAIQDILGQLISGGMEMGSNVMSRTSQPLQMAAAIREFLKQSSQNSGGGGLFGFL